MLQRHCQRQAKVCSFLPSSLVVICKDTLLAVSLLAVTLLPADSFSLQQNLVHLWMHIFLSLEHAQGIAPGAYRVPSALLYMSVRYSGCHMQFTVRSHRLKEVLFAAVRYLSFVFACGKACDKIVLLARMVESDPWIGKSSRVTSRMPWQLWQNQKATSAPTDLMKAS